MLKLRRLLFLLAIVAGVVYFIVFNYLSACISLHSKQHAICLSAVNLQLFTEQQQRKYNVVVVQSAGNFTDRVATFNAFLTSMRVEKLNTLSGNAWQAPSSCGANATLRARGNYLHQLSNYTQVITIGLPYLNVSGNFTSVRYFVHDHSNMLIQTYYKGSANQELCSMIEKSEAKRDIRDHKTVLGEKCSNISDAKMPLPEPYFYRTIINGEYRWPIKNNLCPTHAHFFATFSLVSFMHIVQNALITPQDIVVVEGLQLVLYGCLPRVMKSCFSNFDKFPLYDEVFVICQSWGRGIFHRMVEVLPRVSLFVSFLKFNPDIRIMVPDKGKRTAELLKIIGLQKSRLVVGKMRAKTVYLPKATTCGGPSVQESQMLSGIYRKYIKRTFPFQPRNRMILIRRSGSRKIIQQKQIEEVMKNAATKYRLNYTLFSDNPVPSLNKTMMMFSSAAIIVAPTGAGLSNMLFSHPDTYIIEISCTPPVLCYYRLARALGHRWHGVLARGSCYSRFLDVPALNLSVALDIYLRMWSSKL